MILSDSRIKEQMNNGLIIIHPYNKRHLGPNSYDCRLGEWYYTPNTTIKHIHLDVLEEVRAYWGEPRKADESNCIPVAPGTTILAHTYEVIGSWHSIVAKMHARSSIGRVGLSVCKCAGFGDAGYIGRWTMEISNHTNAKIDIPVGIRICQFEFERVEGNVSQEYHGKYGKYAQDWTPEDMLPKLHLDWEYLE